MACYNCYVPPFQTKPCTNISLEIATNTISGIYAYFFRIKNNGPSAARDLILTVNYTGGFVSVVTQPGMTWDVIPSDQIAIGTIPYLNPDQIITPGIVFNTVPSSVNAVVTSGTKICNPSLVTASAASPLS